ncbi:MAG: DUF4198 domain-containing protein [Pseudomonadota bacterium]
MSSTTSPLRGLCAIAAACALWAAGPAQAHQVWLEQTSTGATLFFGEFGENLREASPGLLDKFVKPTAHKISAQATQPLVLSKTAGGFAIAGTAAKGESLVAEEGTYPISEFKDKDKGTTVRSLYQPAARLVTHLGAHPASLTLDLVPTGTSTKDSVEVQAFYKGKPLPKAKVAIVTASGWAQEHHTNEAGKLTASLPWAGTYVLELSHADRTAGQRGTEAYDRANYVTSLTLVQADGLAALPAPPAAAPNK